MYFTLIDAGQSNLNNQQGAIAGHHGLLLWQYLRLIDENGTGKVTFRFQDAAEVFERSKISVKRWLNQGLKLCFFRWVKKIDTKEREVYLSSYKQVCKLLGIADLGTYAEIDIANLKYWRYIATEATVEQLQRQSQFASKKSSKRIVGRAINPTEILNPSDVSPSGVIKQVGRFTLLDAVTRPIGGCHDTIARLLNRHPSTIQIRLSDTWRSRRGIPLVKKTQLAQTKPEYEACLYEQQHSLTGDRSGRYFRVYGLRGVFKALANGYYFPDLKLRHKRRRRQELARYLAKTKRAIANGEGQQIGKSPQPGAVIDKTVLSKKTTAPGNRNDLNNLSKQP